ncbi:hypothetical protein L484_018427 [Morus notabilis]|uniref:PRLI-interacting factor A n=1 Tax=Morus notabilis TaxID=981085 RepID=W9QYD8_9ROSA|nr:uncharacterized protein LOC21401397 [Morus notabilis]XP_024020583.1 uncharacterized protein LOC21401397 [Morus notabilis]EXB29011.1 hypothetical protein L484_018427 [Morus notabilis]
MNDQSQMMNQAQMMGMSNAQVMSQPPMMNQPPMMSQPPQIMSQPQMIGSIAQSSQPQMMMSQSQAMAPQPQQPQLMMMTSQSQPPMMNRGYKAWLQPQQPSMDPNKKFQGSMKPNFAASKPGRNNWKGKKGTDKRQDLRRIENLAPNPSMSGTTSSGGGYIPPTLHELQSQNRLKARKFYPKKKFNNRFAPYAPRNTTSFIIRAKKSGGIASLVSPCPVTPAVLPTPIFSPSREVLGDMAKEEWGVDGYGSMKGLIRLRSPGNEDEEEEEGGGGSSESDVEEHVEVERRLDHDLSRFEMIYPNYSGMEYNNVLENRVDDQDTHIAQLEEENLTLKERLFLMERELGDLRRRLQFLERQNHMVGDVHEEVVENESENDSEGGSGAPDMCLSGKNHEEVVECMSGQEGSKDAEVESKKEQDDNGAPEIECTGDVCMEDLEHHEVNAQQKEDIYLEHHEVNGQEKEDFNLKHYEVNAQEKEDINLEHHEVNAQEKEDVKGEELRNEMNVVKDEIKEEEVKIEKKADEVITGNEDSSNSEEPRTSS